MSIVYSRKEIAERLEQRAPLLMLDGAEVDAGGAETAPSAYAVKYVSANEPIFAGHFPAKPILPGVMQVAAMAQLCALLARALYGEQRYFLKELCRVKFRHPITPGAKMEVKATHEGITPEGFSTYKAECTVYGAVFSSATLTLAPYARAGWKEPPERQLLLLPAPLCNVEEIMEVLPHRPPFLLVDGIYCLGHDKERVIGFKHLTAGDALLGDDADIYPPYLMVESAAQMCCANVLAMKENAGKIGLFMSIDKAHFDRPVPLGNCLDMSAECQSSGKAGAAQVTFLCCGCPVGHADLKYVLTTIDKV